jgi:hypothetical protein
MSSAKVHLSMMGSQTAMSGLKKVLESEMTVERMDFDLVWWKMSCDSLSVRSKTGTYLWMWMY